MTAKATFDKVVTALALAKAVNHYYWVHTDWTATDEDGGVNIENIQAVISIMTQASIEKKLVIGESGYHRSWVERYGENGKTCIIYVTEDQPQEWQRFAVIKELCHILIDTPSDFQPNFQVTVSEVCNGSTLIDDDVSVEKRSEDISELIALELIYPLEDRRDDRRSLAAEVTTPEQLSKKRCIPLKYIHRGVSDASYEACLEVWKRLADVEPPNLDEYIGK